MLASCVRLERLELSDGGEPLACADFGVVAAACTNLRRLVVRFSLAHTHREAYERLFPARDPRTGKPLAAAAVVPAVTGPWGAPNLSLRALAGRRALQLIVLCRDRHARLLSDPDSDSASADTHERCERERWDVPRTAEDVARIGAAAEATRAADERAIAQRLGWMARHQAHIPGPHTHILPDFECAACRYPAVFAGRCGCEYCVCGRIGKGECGCGSAHRMAETHLTCSEEPPAPPRLPEGNPDGDYGDH